MIDRGPDSRSSSGGTDRGVSEVVAFVLVFAMILGSIGILYTIGFGALNDYQEHEQTVNAERAMEALTDNFNDVIRYSGINQRQGELSLREGTITTSDGGTSVTVSVNGDELETDLGELRYDHEDARIAYEGGALVRSDDAQTWSTVRKDPWMTCQRDGAVVISLVSISGDHQSVSSSTGQSVTMSVDDRESKVWDDPGDSVNVTVESSYEEAWDESFDEDWERVGDSEWSCSDPDRVVVTIVEVDVEI